MIGERSYKEIIPEKTLKLFKDEVFQFCDDIKNNVDDKEAAQEYLDKLYDYFNDCLEYKNTPDTVMFQAVQARLSEEISSIKSRFPDLVKPFNPEEYKINDLNIHDIEEEIKS